MQSVVLNRGSPTLITTTKIGRRGLIWETIIMDFLIQLTNYNLMGLMEIIIMMNKKNLRR